MEWIFDYSIMLANGDGDSGEWPMELSAQELDTALDAIIDRADFEAAMDKSGATERAYAEVMADVGSELLHNVEFDGDCDDDQGYVYDEDCDLDINPQEPDFTDDRLIEVLIKRAVLRSRAEGAGIVADAIERFGKFYSEDPEELALGYAVTYGAKGYLAYVRKEADDEPGKNPETAVTDAPEKAENDGFFGCSFAVEAESWRILACTKAFQQELFQLLLDENDLEREDVVAFLEGGEEPSYKGDLKRTLRSIGVFPCDGDVAFENMTGEDGCEMTELIDWLGINYETDRSGGKEVYYIK